MTTPSKADRLKEIPVPQNEHGMADVEYERDYRGPGPEMFVFYELKEGSKPIPWEVYKVEDVERLASLSQPVPQGEQSLPPQLVRPETIRARTLGGTNFIAYEANEADAVFSNLETELLDTKRALELCLGGNTPKFAIGTGIPKRVEAMVESARKERKGQQNG